MTTNFQSVSALSDDQLLSTVNRLAGDERQATASFIAALAEFDRRKLYLAQGYSSAFVYCTRALHLAEHAAYNRIEAARAVARWPQLLHHLEEGSVNLSTLRLVAPHITADNISSVLQSVGYKSKREVEQFVAALRPRPDVQAMIRKLPTAGTSVAATRLDAPATDVASDTITRTVSAPAAECPTNSALGPTMARGAAAPPQPVPLPRSHAPILAPLSAERFRVQFTFGRESHDRLRRVQDLMRHTVPTGDLAAIFDRAILVLLQTLERRKLAQTNGRTREPSAPAKRSRHIPAAVRREVWRRDAGRCAFVGDQGRCPETGFLEWHHATMFTDGGAATAANIELRCRAHNLYEAERLFPIVPADDDEGDSPRGEFT